MEVGGVDGKRKERNQTKIGLRRKRQTDRIFNSLDSKDVRRAEGGKCVHAKARKKKRDCSPF